MPDEFRILFLSGPDCTGSFLAAESLNLVAMQGAVAAFAGVSGAAVDPRAMEFLNREDSAIPSVTGRLAAELDLVGHDLVVTLDDEALAWWKNDASPGGEALVVDAPLHLHWTVPSFAASAKGEPPNALGAVIVSLQQKIAPFLQDGYLTILAGQRANTRRLVDSLGDGLIVHDDRRRILLFNREAERITGFSRQEVLGQDCHQVFGPDGICGAQCSFQDDRPKTAGEREYQLGFTARDGQQKLIRMTVTPLAPGSHGQGVIISLRDITEVSEMRRQHSFHGMVGVSRAMQEVFETIRQVVTADYPVLIVGESGTGKELVANAIHHESRRGGGPFVPINCGALPENILESELFGHVRGAFTGAIRDKKGRFELADGGTLFLDEVGELTPAFQVKLLRVLQEKRFERVGGEQPISVDVRVISATNRDLRELVNVGRFREDLYYRLVVVPINLPPLRERREDILPLISQILDQIRRETDKRTLTVSDDAVDHLLGYHWPGNVRELINVLRFGAVRCGGDLVLRKHLPPEVREAPARPFPRPVIPEERGPAAAAPSPRHQGILASEAVTGALAQAGGNKVKAARILGVGRATLYRFLAKEQDSRR